MTTKNKVFVDITAIFAIISLSLVVFLFTGNPPRWHIVVDRGIYSNYHHYLECDKLPLYGDAKKEFEANKSGLVDLVIKLSNINASSEVAKNFKNVEITENQIRTDYITIRLMEKCDNPNQKVVRAELNIDVMSDSQAQEIIKYIEQNNINIPYNITNG